MNLLKLVFAMAPLFAGSLAFAQSGATVKALLVDESTGERVGFATVSITPSGKTTVSKYGQSADDGTVTLKSVTKGKYDFKVDIMGYKPYSAEISVGEKDLDLGTIKLSLDTRMLEAASVSAVGNSVVVKKDTVEYTASSFKTTDNDVLEDLLKKLPGVEVSEDGSITANGETISKITIDGKTFFLDDPQMASKNIPAKMVNRLKIIKQKSEESQFTGIDDGEEETVIDLSVQPEMMRGLFGQVSAGGGSDIPSQQEISPEARYVGNAFIGRFTSNSQISLILNGNNTNNRGSTNRSGNMMAGMMSGAMGGGQGGWGRGNGITTSYMAGINAAGDLFDDRMEIGGNYVFNNSNNDVMESSNKTTFLENNNLIYNSSGVSNTNSGGHSFGLRMEHEFSENTSILFEPQVSFGTGSYVQSSRDTTYNDDLAGNVSKLNEAYTDNSGNNKNVSTSARFLFRQRLGKPGRTLTANVNFSYSNNRLKGLNENGTRSFLDDGTETLESVNQSFDNVQRSTSLSGRLTYTEPIAERLYLEANYSYNWSRSLSDKTTFDLDNGGAIDYNYSNNIVNESNRQQIGANIMYQAEQVRAQLGFSAIPTRTYNSTTKYDQTAGTYSPQVYDDFRWNFSPQAMLMLDPSDYFSTRIRYRGNTSQPSTSQLMPVPDNSDPLNITFGNPSLTPYFSHNLNADINYTNRVKFASASLRLRGGFTQNPIVNAVWYGSNGAQYSMPFNGPTTANASANMFFNIPVGETGFSINNSLNSSWSRGASYVGTDIDMSTYEDPDKGFYDFMEEFIGNFNDPDYFAEHITENITTTVSMNERLNLRYRTDALEVSLGGRTRMNKSWYTIATLQDQTTTWNNQASVGLTYEWTSLGLTFDSDFNYNWYNGYSTPQPSECVLNAEISKTLFNNLTLSLSGYDILGQSKNLTVSDNSNYHSETVNNTLGRYIIVSVSWRFGTMGGSRGMRGPGGGPGMPPGGGRPPMR